MAYLACPDNIHCIQKIIDETIRERNELCQENGFIRNRSETLKCHLDNLFCKCKNQHVELIRQEELNNKLVTDNMKLEQIVSYMKACVKQKNEDLENNALAQEDYEKFARLNEYQKSMLEETRKENENIRQAIKEKDIELEQMRINCPRQMENIKRDVLNMRETEVMLRGEIERLENDRRKLNKYYYEAKQDFERTCDKLAYQEQLLAKCKECMNSLTIQMNNVEQKFDNTQITNISPTQDLSTPVVVPEVSPNKSGGNSIHKQNASAPKSPTKIPPKSKFTSPTIGQKGSLSFPKQNQKKNEEPVAEKKPAALQKKVHFGEGQSFCVDLESVPDLPSLTSATFSNMPLKKSAKATATVAPVSILKNAMDSISYCDLISPASSVRVKKKRCIFRRIKRRKMCNIQ